MTRYDRRTQLFAVCLSALAGYVDALGFLHLGGFFVSFMSGNSTRLGVGLANDMHAAATAAGLIGTFVAGAILGSLVGRAARDRRRAGVLALVAALLAGAALLATSGRSHGAIVLMALAMGAENAVFEGKGEVHIGLTYMTGTLVKFSQRVADALTGGDRLAWLPFLALWLGLIGGATLGAAMYPALGLGGLWLATGAAILLAVVAVGMNDERGATR